MPAAAVHRLATAGPDDCDGLLRAIDAGTIDPDGIVAILGKTEGNGCVNDFTRGFAVESLRAALRPRRSIGFDVENISMVMSGGTEGGLSPHLVVIEVAAGDRASSIERPSLAVGVGRTSDLSPEQIGRLTQVEAVAAEVRAVMARADIVDVADVHYVQVKCPLLTGPRIAEAAGRGASVATTDTLKSMGLSRAASALGVAVALGELDLAEIDDESIGTDLDLCSGRASCSAGIELMDNEIVVMGNSAAWNSDVMIGHGVMQDALDVHAVDDALRSVGIEPERQLSAAMQQRLVAVLAKAEPDPTAAIRGKRHTMLGDSDIPGTRHARALVGGVIGGIVGHTELFISGGAEHQGPPGGGPVAVIASR